MLAEMLFGPVDEAHSGKALIRSEACLLGSPASFCTLFCASMIPTSRIEAQLLIEEYCVGSKPSCWTPLFVEVYLVQSS